MMSLGARSADVLGWPGARVARRMQARAEKARQRPSSAAVPAPAEDQQAPEHASAEDEWELLEQAAAAEAAAAAAADEQVVDDDDVLF